MTHYRIFTSASGDFRDSSKYTFVAEFADKGITMNYVKYMTGKRAYQGRDIIIKTVDAGEFDPKEGKVDGVLSAIGESLPVEEYEFV